jgi:spore coat protein H
MAPAYVEELYGRDEMDDDRLNASYRLEVDGELTAEGAAGVRFRGYSSRRLPKKSFNVELDASVPGFDTDRLNLNAMFTDPSLLREQLAFDLFADQGVPAPTRSYVEVYLNDVYEGLYLYVQRVDADLLRDAGLEGNGATLVRDETRERTGGHGSVLSTPAEPFATTTDLTAYLDTMMELRGEPNWSAVAELVSWAHRWDRSGARLSSEAAAQATGELAELLDREALLRFMTAQVLSGDVDWYSDDYWLARPGGDDARFVVIPWDKDLSFGRHWAEALGQSTNHLFFVDWPINRAINRNALTRIAFSDRRLRRDFHARLLDSLRSSFTVNRVCERLAALSPTVEPHVDRRAPDDGFARHRQQHFAHPGDHELHVAALLDYVQRRREFLSAQIGGAPSGSSRTTGMATVHVGPDDVGSSVLFTDAGGWVIARLDVFSVGAAGDVTISVEEDSISGDVDRSWEVDTSTASVDGRLNLYYRNNPVHGDWYRPAANGGVQAVGDQARLEVVEIPAGADLAQGTRLPTVVNPYSDRAITVTTLDGIHHFVLAER